MEEEEGGRRKKGRVKREKGKKENRGGKKREEKISMNEKRGENKKYTCILNLEEKERIFRKTLVFDFCKSIIKKKGKVWCSFHEENQNNNIIFLKLRN